MFIAPHTQREFDLLRKVHELQSEASIAIAERDYLRAERRRLLDEIGDVNKEVNRIRCEYESDEIPF